MRLKSGIWVAAYVRRCNVEGVFAAVRRRGADEAGAIFIKINRLDGTATLYGPAPQTAFDEASPPTACSPPSWEAFSRRRTRMWKRSSRANSASIPICGLSKWRIAPAGISSRMS